MNNLLTHYPVNWIDGMKLNSRTHSYYTRHELQARASRGSVPFINLSTAHTTSSIGSVPKIRCNMTTALESRLRLSRSSSRGLTFCLSIYVSF